MTAPETAPSAPWVGIIANPVSARDIRRITGHAGSLPLAERVNLLLRMMVALAGCGIREVRMMPDREGLRALLLREPTMLGLALGLYASGRIPAAQALDAPQRVRTLSLIGSAGFGPQINQAYTQGFIDAQTRRELKPVIELLFADRSLVSRQMLDDLLKYKRLDGVTESLNALHQGLFAAGQQAALPGRELDGRSPPLLVI